MLSYDVYTKFHEVWITCSETECGGEGQRSLFFFLAYCTLFEPRADSIAHLHVEPFQIRYAITLKGYGISGLYVWSISFFYRKVLSYLCFAHQPRAVYV
jgi:hypothetical protein